MGRYGTATGSATLTSDINGQLGSLSVAGDVAVTATYTSCQLARAELPAGVNRFVITNNGNKITEFYVYQGSKALGEVENISPQTSRNLAAIEQLGELLLKSEDGRRLLQDAVELRSRQLVSDLESRLRQDVENELASAHEELKNLQVEIAAERANHEMIGRNVVDITRQKDDIESNIRTVESELKGSRELLRASRSEVDEIILRRAAAHAQVNEWGQAGDDHSMIVNRR